MSLFVGDSEVKKMNDYIFTIEISTKDGSNVRQKNIIVSAENAEIAYDKVINKVCAGNYVIHNLVDVKKL